MSLPLDEVLKLWAATRADEVSLLADRLSPPPARPLFPKSATFEVRQRRWLAAAAGFEASSLPTLLETLRDGASDDVRERLDVVATWGDDPRIASALVRMWEQPTHLNVSTLFLWQALAKELLRRPDARSLKRLDAVAALGDGWVGLFRPHMRPRIPGLLEETRQALAARVSKLKVRALTHAERAALERATPAPGPEDALAAICADPTDLTRRLVYADMLTTAGDPRGEFISLQCLASRTPAQQKRMAKLLREHRDAWGAPLRKICTIDAFEQGFPSHVTVDVKSRLALGPLLGHPAWSTVHTINPGWHLEVVVHPAMTRVLRLTGLQPSSIRSLAKHKRAFPMRSLVFAWSDAWRVFSLLAKPDLFPHLVEVHVEHLPPPGDRMGARKATEVLRAARPNVHISVGRQPLEHPATLRGR